MVVTSSSIRTRPRTQVRRLLRDDLSPPNVAQASCLPTERRSGYTAQELTRHECDAFKPMHENLAPDHLIVSVIPQIEGSGPAKDGFTECIIPNIVKKYIMTTPGFPAPVPRPSPDDEEGNSELAYN